MLKGILAMLVGMAVLQGPVPVPETATSYWDDPNPDGTVAEYRMYCGPTSPVIQDEAHRVATIDYPTKQWSIVLPLGIHHCAVSALNINGTLESGLSNELAVDVYRFGAPTNFEVR